MFIPDMAPRFCIIRVLPPSPILGPDPLPLQFGLPTEWVSRLVRLDPERRQVLRVHSRVAGSHAQEVRAQLLLLQMDGLACLSCSMLDSNLTILILIPCACVAPLQVLCDADMVLAISGQPVSSYNDVERIIAEAAAAAAVAGLAAGSADVAAVQAAGAEAAGVAQQLEQPPAKRARVSGEGTGAEAAAQQLPEVQLTIFRDSAVQEVTVRCVACFCRPPAVHPPGHAFGGCHSACCVCDPFSGQEHSPWSQPCLQAGRRGRAGHQSDGALVRRTAAGEHAPPIFHVSWTSL